VGVADAAHRLAEELPDDERPEAARLVARVTRPLPTRFPRAWSGEEAATDAATALFLEHTREPPPLPTDEPAPAAATPVAPARRPRRVSRVSRVAHALRTNQWWGHMLGPIVAFAYLQLGWRQVPPGEGIGRVLALLASAIALAGYGYVVNDTADVDADRRAGKSNAMAKLPFAARLAVVAMFAALGAVPWLFISLEGPALAALAGIYLVPLLYSPPPVRLKERNVLGPLADATNAFLLPALFTVALFAPLGSPTGPAAMMIVGAVLWAVGFGLRAILIHQIADAANDQASGTVTLVGRIGAPRAIKVMRAFLFPLELAGAALLTATVATWSWGAVAAGLLYAAAFHAARLSGVIDRGLATTTLDRGWFMYWYQIWPALLLSVALAVSDPWYVLLVGLVALLFWPRVRSGLGIFRREARRELRRHGVLGKAAGPGRA
jgi:1,4-dihydroxy-2-naphthoate octaprenyltransferase